MAVPAIQEYLYEVQDDRGFRAHMRLTGFIADVSAATVHLSVIAGNAGAIGTALQAMTNAKIVSTGFAMRFDIAQEPTSESGVYQLVEQGAILSFGDGNTGRERLTIPAPVDALFLTGGADNLIVVDPAASVLTALQSATTTDIVTATGGQWGAQFFGGQLKGTKPRVRRVLQGA